MAKRGQPLAEKPAPKARNAPEKPRIPNNNQRPKQTDDGWIWGVHTVEAALKNLSRPRPLTLYITPNRLEELSEKRLKSEQLRVQPLESSELSRLLPQGAVHQGIALKGAALEGEDLETLIDGGGVLLMLDQVTDPQNVGAIFRSAAAFGASGLIFQERHSPAMQGTLAKTAAGAMDAVPFAKVTNLSRALERLTDAGFVSIGLAGETDQTLQGVLEAINWREKSRPLVIVLGSEGEGIRRLVSEHCEHLARIPMPGGFESLNVSHATSIALYECLGRS